MPSGLGKTLSDQVDEIDRILSDAQQQLAQARWALDTLQGRLQTLAAAAEGASRDTGRAGADE